MLRTRHFVIQYNMISEIGPMQCLVRVFSVILNCWYKIYKYSLLQTSVLTEISKFGPEKSYLDETHPSVKAKSSAHDLRDPSTSWNLSITRWGRRSWPHIIRKLQAKMMKTRADKHIIIESYWNLWRDHRQYEPF